MHLPTRRAHISTGGVGGRGRGAGCAASLTGLSAQIGRPRFEGSGTVAPARPGEEGAPEGSVPCAPPPPRGLPPPWRRKPDRGLCIGGGAQLTAAIACCRRRRCCCVGGAGECRIGGVSPRLAALDWETGPGRATLSSSANAMAASAPTAMASAREGGLLCLGRVERFNFQMCRMRVCVNQHHVRRLIQKID
jgi:hypothetical protein